MHDATRAGSLGRSYLNIFRECVMSISHCIDNYIPGILNWAEMHEVFGVPGNTGQEVFDGGEDWK